MKLLTITCGILFIATAFASDREDVMALGKLTTAPAMTEAEGYESTDNLKAIFFDGLDYKGKPTKVFAWLGLPEKRVGKVPGVVLVHGGGGTAFKDWVRKWNAHGFAAIAIAVEGQTDQRNPKMSGQDNPKGWAPHKWPGPARKGIYGDSAEPLKDQWMYHAVADTVLANSLLRSLPEVDADHIGIMGISWGGVITSTVIGIDDRLAFAIPTYGCGNLAEAGNQYGRSLGNNDLYKTVWDPMVRLKNARMPTLWLSWPGDQHFPLDKQSACYKAMSGKYMVSLIPGMKHGHGAGWNPPDSYAFAKSVVEDGRAWVDLDRTRSVDGVAEVLLTSFKPLDQAVLISTVDSGVTGSRKWVESEAVLVETGALKYKVTALLPQGTTAWFINVRSGGLTASSAYHSVQ